MKTTHSYNVQIWVGLRVGYTDENHTLDEVRYLCDQYVNEVKQLYIEVGECAYRIDEKGFIIERIIPYDTTKLYTEEEVIKLTKEAVGLWRDEHNKKLYQSKKYFGDWINKKLKIK